MRPPQVTETKSGKTGILNEKKIMLSKNFKLSSQVKGNSVKGCDFFKFLTSVRGGHCDYSPGTRKRSYSSGFGINDLESSDSATTALVRSLEVKTSDKE
jgi:hypothetical protein